MWINNQSQVKYSFLYLPILADLKLGIGAKCAFRFSMGDSFVITHWYNFPGQRTREEREPSANYLQNFIFLEIAFLKSYYCPALCRPPCTSIPRYHLTRRSLLKEISLKSLGILKPASPSHPITHASASTLPRQISQSAARQERGR